MNISRMKFIYYRGYGKDCNYSCSYCIFARNKLVNIEKDKKYLDKFVNYIEKTKFEEKISIMFTPYGEALTKKYYFEGIKKLVSHKDIESVSCQTNGSFNEKEFINYFSQEELEKISLWVSYHPEMVQVEKFAKKINFLNEKIKISVGAVGIKENKNKLESLKKLLNSNIYFWINKLEGIKTEDYDFSYIDPYYSLEEEKLRCDINKCQGGIKSIFIKEEGKAYLCHTSKISCGNLYDDKEIVRNKSGRCNCYLTYSNRCDLNFPSLIHRQQRYFKYKLPKAIFFDIDGTLITEEKNYLLELLEISKKYKIYFFTGRSRENLMKTYPELREVLKEGVFSYGAHIRVNEKEIINYLDEKNKIIKKSSRKKLNEEEIKSYKEGVKILEEDGIYHLINKKASKLNGVEEICKVMGYNKNEVWVVGNGKHDAKVLKNFPASFAVINSHEEAKKSASTIINIEEILNILKRS